MNTLHDKFISAIRGLFESDDVVCISSVHYSDLYKASAINFLSKSLEKSPEEQDLLGPYFQILMNPVVDFVDMGEKIAINNEERIESPENVFFTLSLNCCSFINGNWVTRAIGTAKFYGHLMYDTKTNLILSNAEINENLSKIKETGAEGKPFESLTFFEVLKHAAENENINMVYKNVYRIDFTDLSKNDFPLTENKKQHISELSYNRFEEFLVNEYINICSSVESLMTTLSILPEELKKNILKKLENKSDYPKNVVVN